MAKIIEEIIIIKLSKLTKDATKETTPLASPELLLDIESVIQELVPQAMIEIISGDDDA